MDGPKHTPAYTDCWCRPARGRRKRVPRDEVGLPLGEGGDECATCGGKHEHGVGCGPAGLKARGWVMNGKGADGRMTWLHPRTAKRSAARGRRRQRMIEVASPVAEILTGSASPRTKRVWREQLKRLPAAAPADFTQRLDPQTQGLWLRTAKARMGGLTVAQIAEVCDLDKALLERLVRSPQYLTFESEFRQVMLRDQSKVEAMQARAWGLMNKTMDAYEWILDLRRTEVGYKHMQQIIGVAKQVASIVGLDIERKRVLHQHAHLHASLSPQRAERLAEALTKEGA